MGTTYVHQEDASHTHKTPSAQVLAGLGRDGCQMKMAELTVASIILYPSTSTLSALRGFPTTQKAAIMQRRKKTFPELIRNTKPM